MRTKITLELATMLVALESWASVTIVNAAVRYSLPYFIWPGIFIISAQRSIEHNRNVGGVEGSLHTLCPSPAVDIRVGAVATGDAANPMLDWLGARWMQMGGRWGGLFTDHPNKGHLDLGPAIGL